MYNKKPLSTPASLIAQASKITVLCASLALVAACGKTIKPEERNPTKLVQLEQAINVVEPVFQTSISDRSKLADVNRFEVGFDGKQLVVASGAGKVQSYGLNGQTLWSVDLKEDIVGAVAFDSTSQTAVVTTKSARVVALDTNNGQVKWENKVSRSTSCPLGMGQRRKNVSPGTGVVYKYHTNSSFLILEL